ncbi:MAG: hypothetical protein U9P88_00225 [Patescibacteria group bacterium]|nr:hypothetical protein [Patescibacteria group bacterium]
MEHEALQKHQKSKFWIIANIWLTIIVGLVVFGIIWRIISWLLYSRLGVGENLIVILELLAIIGILFYSVRLGVKLVLNKSIISTKEVIKISFWVAIILVIVQIITMAIYSSKLPIWHLTQIGKLAVIDLSIFFITYYWLKKLIPKTQNQ